MSDTQFDLIVLGTGPSGGTVATEVASQGRRVAIVDVREFGGTCALRGCNPKKVFTNAAAVVDRVRRNQGKLLGQADVAIDWPSLQQFKREFTLPVLQNKEASFREKGIATYHGLARFVDNDNDGLKPRVDVGGTTLTADRVVIATGAIPLPLDFADSDCISLSDDFLELVALPERVVFIGGGYVSMEFAHVVARAGASATVVERNPRVLSNFDPDLVDRLSDYSRRRGIDIRTDSQVHAVSRDDDGSFIVKLDDEEIQADLVIHGAGRVPNIRELNLTAANVQYGDDGVVVDCHLRSPSNPNVFACGDCAASEKARLTPVANEQARVVARNLFAEIPDAIEDSGPIAKVVFTTPILASVGLSQEQARKNYPQLVVHFEETSSSGSVRKTGGTVAAHKILIDSKTDQIVGAHLLGPAAEETINLFTLAIGNHLTTTNIKSTLFAFPTFGHDVRQMV